MGDQTTQTTSHPEVRHEMLLEGLTMALYVAIVLLALIAGTGDHLVEVGDDLKLLVPGTAIGLVLAHVFAFSLSRAVVTEAGHTARERMLPVASMIAGALLVIAVAEVPLLVFDDIERAALWSELALVAVIGGTAWFAAVDGGASRKRAAAYTAVILLIAGAVVATKVALGGH